MAAKKPAVKKPASKRDKDGDGHDDATGEFVEGNQAATKPKKAQVKKPKARDYRTRLCPEDEAAFQQWVGKGYDDSPSTPYDARGYWHAAVLHGEEVDEALFRTPYHKEFPAGSRWAG